MAVNFVKAANGNVNFDNNGNDYVLMPNRVVLSKSPNDTDIIYVNSADFSKFKVKYSEVVLPATANRDALFVELGTNFFFQA